MNILTMCQRGNHRSVLTASILRNKKGYRDVISCGAFTFSQETLTMLYEWADKILIMTAEISPEIVHPEYRDKVIVMDLGVDPYGANFHPPFKDKAEKYLEEAGL